MQLPHLLDQLAHLRRASAGCGLIGHRAHPLDQIRLQQAVERQ